eukprot:CAMPEP_0181175118 /NCGR_PEP_ID=MMETSP1096-20121128/3904_1 /TAXON_ID=156174 ORGANISM="Chrysochromulina ericina, Strain CCMP281" /NCGR_SAMPLE_ID=MMETSP1096 /ASSEMBLY_ACC=CAM_ASM_000453 /LENGTH=134 /DNA_ID=CAMNT_0023263075 /DNA_START=503 /DNA_END=905 /DNA_ORIENTATION=-
MRQKSGIEICSGWVDGAQIPLGVQVADANTPSGCDGWGRELRRYILEGQGEGGWLRSSRHEEDRMREVAQRLDQVCDELPTLPFTAPVKLSLCPGVPYLVDRNHVTIGDDWPHGIHRGADTQIEAEDEGAADDR